MRVVWLMLVLGCGAARVSEPVTAATPAPSPAPTRAAAPEEETPPAETVETTELAVPSPPEPSTFPAAAGTPWASFTPYDATVPEGAPDMEGDFVAITTAAMPAFELEGVVIPLNSSEEQTWLADVWQAIVEAQLTEQRPPWLRMIGDEEAWFAQCRERPPALRNGAPATIIGPRGPVAARVTGCRIAQDDHEVFAFVTVRPSPGPLALVRFGPAVGQLVAPAPVPATDDFAARVRAQLEDHADLSLIAGQIDDASVERFAARMPAPAAAIVRVAQPAGCTTVEDCELLALVATREDGELVAIFQVWSVIHETHARTLLSLQSQTGAANVLWLVRGRGEYDELLVYVTDLGLDAIVRVTFEPDFTARWLFSHPSG